MLGKKLLTLACVAGIVALGACFLPPIPAPLPPPRIDLHGIRHLCVTVSNKTEPQPIDPSTLAAHTAQWIDRRVDGRILRATASCAPSDDGTLHLEMLSESATPQENSASPGPSRWCVAVTLNATLTDRSGAVVWRAANFEFVYPRPLPAPDAATLWRDRENQIAYLLASRLATRFLHGD